MKAATRLEGYAHEGMPLSLLLMKYTHLLWRHDFISTFEGRYEVSDCRLTVRGLPSPLAAEHGVCVLGSILQMMTVRPLMGCTL